MEETEFDIKVKAYRLLMDTTIDELSKVEDTINSLMEKRTILMDRIRIMRTTIIMRDTIDKAVPYQHKKR